MQDPRPTNMPWIIPYLSVADVEQAIDVYCNVFGFSVIETSNYGADKVIHAELRYHDMVVMCGDINMHKHDMKTPAAGKFSSPVSLYVYCENVDELYKRAQTKGLKIVYELENAFWGDRMFACEDADGHAWSFGTHITNANSV